jgi:hypothetical protein
VTTASAPPGCRAAAARSSATVGSIQWNAVAAKTARNGSGGSAHSSNAAVTTSTPATPASLRRATAARPAPSSTATIA